MILIHNLYIIIVHSIPSWYC